MTERVRERPGRSRLALAADALTIVRVPLAAALAIALGLFDALEIGAALLSTAWVTDFLDGRLARRSGSATAMGSWDPIADAMVGLCVLIGLLIGARIGFVPWLVIAVILCAGFLVSGNLSLGMMLQAMAYGLFIVELAVDAAGILWLPAATVALIGIADGRRFAFEVLPTFFAGLGIGTGPVGREND